MTDTPVSAGLVALAERIELTEPGLLGVDGRALNQPARQWPRRALSSPDQPMPSRPPVHRPAGWRSAAEVKRALDRERPSASRRGYDAQWRRARDAFLARHPLCIRCRAAGRLEPAIVVDHRVPHRGRAELFWDEANWQSLCKRCHDAKTAREGRWG